jgi:hypothetical protein
VVSTQSTTRYVEQVFFFFFFFTCSVVWNYSLKELGAQCWFAYIIYLILKNRIRGNLCHWNHAVYTLKPHDDSPRKVA